MHYLYSLAFAIVEQPYSDENLKNFSSVLTMILAEPAGTHTKIKALEQQLKVKIEQPPDDSLSFMAAQKEISSYTSLNLLEYCLFNNRTRYVEVLLSKKKELNIDFNKSFNFNRHVFTPLTYILSECYITVIIYGQGFSPLMSMLFHPDVDLKQLNSKGKPVLFQYLDAINPYQGFGESYPGTIMSIMKSCYVAGMDFNQLFRKDTLLSYFKKSGKMRLVPELCSFLQSPQKFIRNDGISKLMLNSKQKETKPDSGVSLQSGLSFECPLIPLPDTLFRLIVDYLDNNPDPRYFSRIHTHYISIFLATSAMLQLDLQVLMPELKSKPTYLRFASQLLESFVSDSREQKAIVLARIKGLFAKLPQQPQEEAPKRFIELVNEAANQLGL